MNLNHRPGELLPRVGGPRRLPRYAAAVALASGLAMTARGVNLHAAAPSVLILYDSGGTWGYLGAEYALMLRNVLGHFSATVTSEPVTHYAAGQMNNHAVTFYIGSTYAEPSYYPTNSMQYASYFAFIRDAATT